MSNELLQWISVSGRLLGAAFYYDPQDKRMSAILDFFKKPNWQLNWFGLEEKVEIATLIQAGLEQNLSEAYQALFIGPYELVAPPWGSVYLDPESVIFGESLLGLRSFLQKNQITYLELKNEPEDHFGLMLMFAAFLAENQPKLLSEFCNQHLLPWGYRYLELLSEQSSYPFYQGLAKLTQETLKQWQKEAKWIPADLRLYR